MGDNSSNNEIIDGKSLAEISGIHDKDDTASILKNLKDSLTEEMQKEYALLEELCDYCKPSKVEEKDKGKPVDDVKDVAAIKKFQNSPIAGSILIHHDFEKLFDILKGMSIGTTLASGGKKKEKEESGGKKKKIDFIGKLKEAGEDVLLFFKSILQVGLMAPVLVATLPVLIVSTLLLAVALKILQKMIWPNLPNEQQIENAKNFGPAMQSLFSGIKELAKSVLIIPLIAVPLLLSIPLMPLIKLFTKGMVNISKDSAQESKSFKKSILSFGLMASSLLLLSIGIGIAVKMGVSIKSAIKAVAFAAIFMVGVIALGALAGFAKWGIITLGLASFLMAGAFLMTSLALKILSNMDKELQIKKLISVLASLLLVVVGIAAIGLASFIALVPTLVFLVFSAALLISLAAFWVSMKLLSSISKMMDNYKTGLQSIQDFINIFVQGVGEYLLGALSALAFAVFSVFLAVGLLLFLVDIGLMKLITKVGIENCDLALTMINTVTNSLAQYDFLRAALVALEFAVFSVALAVGSILFLISLGVLYLISKFKPDTITGATNTIKNVAESFGNNELIKTMAAGVVCAFGLILFGGAFLIGALALWGALVAMEKVTQLSEKLGGAVEGKDSALSKAYKLSVGALLQLCGIESEKNDSVSAKNLLEGAKNCGKLAALAVEMGLYTIPMAASFLALVSVFESMEKLQASVDKIGGKENVDKILGSVGIIFESMSTTAESFKGMSAKAITAIGSLVKDVAQSIGMLADTMIKIKDGIKEEEIAGATNKIKIMCQKMFGDGETDNGEWNLTTLFKTLSNSKLSKLRKDGVDCLVPIIEAISKLGDIVLKMGDPEIFSESRISLGMANFQRISNLFSEFTNLCTGLTQKQSGSTLFSKVFGDKSPLQALNDLVKENFFDTVTTAVDGFNMAGNQLAELNTDGMKPVIEFFGAQSKFFSDWIVTSANFSKGMKEIGSGIGHLKQKDVETFNNFLVTLKTGGNGISVAVQSLVEFANRASDFASIAKSFSSMSDSLNKISKNKHGFMDVMKSANKNKNMEVVAEVTNQGKSSEEKILEKLSTLEEILQSFVPSDNLAHAPGKGIKIYAEKAEPATIGPNKYMNLAGGD